MYIVLHVNVLALCTQARFLGPHNTLPCVLIKTIRDHTQARGIVYMCLRHAIKMSKTYLDHVQATFWPWCKFTMQAAAMTMPYASYLKHISDAFILYQNCTICTEKKECLVTPACILYIYQWTFIPNL